MRSKTRVWCLIAFICSVRGSDPGPRPGCPDRAGHPTARCPRSDTPGTVLGFLSAARKGDYQLARQYLNTRLREAVATQRAEQLFVVLDAKLRSGSPRSAITRRIAIERLVAR